MMLNVTPPSVLRNGGPFEAARKSRLLFVGSMTIDCGALKKSSLTNCQGAPLADLRYTPDGAHKKTAPVGLNAMLDAGPPSGPSDVNVLGAACAMPANAKQTQATNVPLPFFIVVSLPWDVL